MYTYSHVHVQIEVSRNIRSEKKLNEGLELDVPSIYNWPFKSGVTDAKMMVLSVQCT